MNPTYACICGIQPHSTTADSSEGEDGGGGVEGERGEEGMAALKKKMKELSAAHDVVVKNRSVQCAVSDQPLMSSSCCIYQSLHVYDKHT